LFGRQAWVGIADKNLGTITMGRQYDEMTKQLNWTESAVVLRRISRAGPALQVRQRSAILLLCRHLRLESSSRS
jgi:predicted porin